MAKPSEIVRSYYEAFEKHDFQKARSLMHDKFRFVGPLMEANSPEELFAKMKDMGCEFKTHILQMAESGSTVAVLVDCTMTKPAPAKLRMSEWLTVENGKIASSTLVYDTAQMPKSTQA